MREKVRGILLHTIRHNERSNILTFFTEGRGRMAFVSPAGSSKTARMRNARLAPLAIVESEINFRDNRELQMLGAVETPHPWRNIYFDPMKGAMAMFLAEFLNRLLRVSDADPAMWRFLVQAIGALDSMKRGVANYHLAFLIRLLRFAGIEPDAGSWHPGRYFDMRAGEFTDSMPPHPDYLSPAESALLPLMTRMTFRNLHLFRFNVNERRRLLRVLMQYYALHLPVNTDMPSLDVLRELF